MIFGHPAKYQDLQQFQIQNFRSMKPLIYRSNQAPLRELDRLKQRKTVLNLELLQDLE
jgi:hypothetical protein